MAKLPDRQENLTETVEPGEATKRIIQLLAPGSQIGSRYEVRGVLGSGGFSVVYRVWDRELKREVALKVLRADRLTDTTLRRFRREAGVAQDAASPRLVRIFDIGRSGGAVYLTMELVEGPTLRTLLEGGPLTVERTISIGEQILEGLKALHDLEIVHRDVKPANILLAEGGAKLADFGLARRWDREETRATAVEGLIGTVEYLSPEQALGEDADLRSDLYSCGVVLFEALTGQLPHQGRSSLGTLLAHIREPAPDLRQLRPEVPRWLARVVARLLAKEVDHRYASADAVLSDLRERRFAGRGLRFLPRWAIKWRAVALLILITLLLAIWRPWGHLRRGSNNSVSAGDAGRAAAVRGRFSHLVDEAGTAVGIDMAGEELWRAPGFSGTVARLTANQPPKVVGISRRQRDGALISPRVLRVYDPQTFEEVRQVAFPAIESKFPGIADTFGAEVEAVDLNEDGVDEVLVSFRHSPLWPGYLLLWEPRIGRIGFVFFSSGHHNFVRALDLTGDGHKELLLSGIDNKAGWYSGLAAVRLVPAVDQDPERRRITAATPELRYPASNPKTLIWFALLPRNTYVGGPGGDLQIDARRRTIRIGRRDGLTTSVGWDGFPIDAHSALPTAQRETARRAAWEALIEGQRLSRTDQHADAFELLSQARDLAVSANEPSLIEWIERQYAVALIRAGKTTLAAELLQSLTETIEARADAAFDAGEAFFLRGDLVQSQRWFLVGLGRGGGGHLGRGKHEFLEGLVLAAVARGSSRSALEAIGQFAVDPSNRIYDLTLYREMVRWRWGSIPRRLGHLANPGINDLSQYWLLEFDFAAGREPSQVLAAAELEQGYSSEAKPLLAGLAAEALLRMDRPEEALELLDRAVEDARPGLRSSMVLRAHYDLLLYRQIRAARAAGRPAVEQVAREQLRGWLLQHGSITSWRPPYDHPPLDPQLSDDGPQ